MERSWVLTYSPRCLSSKGTEGHFWAWASDVTQVLVSGKETVLGVTKELAAPGKHTKARKRRGAAYGCWTGEGLTHAMSSPFISRTFRVSPMLHDGAFGGQPGSGTARGLQSGQRKSCVWHQVPAQYPCKHPDSQGSWGSQHGWK